jgi:hypothetical protein
MAQVTYRKVRADDGGFRFFKEKEGGQTEEVDLKEYTEKAADGNLYSVLHDSNKRQDLEHLKQSLQQHEMTPELDRTVSDLENRISELEPSNSGVSGDQTVRIPENDSSSGSTDDIGGMQDNNPPSEEQRRDKIRRLGVSDDVIDELPEEAKDYLAGVGAQQVENIRNQEPTPNVWTAETLEQISKEARNNPRINEYYRNQVARENERFTDTVAKVQKDYKYMQEKMQRTFEDQQENLQREEANLGRAFSGIREEAQKELENKQTGLKKSRRRKFKKELEKLKTKQEEKVGTENVPQDDTFNSIEGTMDGMSIDIEGFESENSVPEPQSILGKEKEQDIQNRIKRKSNQYETIAGIGNKS